MIYCLEWLNNHTKIAGHENWRIW